MLGSCQAGRPLAVLHVPIILGGVPRREERSMVAILPKNCQLALGILSLAIRSSAKAMRHDEAELPPEVLRVDVVAELVRITSVAPGQPTPDRRFPRFPHPQFRARPSPCVARDGGRPSGQHTFGPGGPDRAGRRDGGRPAARHRPSRLGHRALGALASSPGGTLPRRPLAAGRGGLAPGRGPLAGGSDDRSYARRGGGDPGPRLAASWRHLGGDRWGAARLPQPPAGGPAFPHPADAPLAPLAPALAAAVAAGGGGGQHPRPCPGGDGVRGRVDAPGHGRAFGPRLMAIPAGAAYLEDDPAEEVGVR